MVAGAAVQLLEGDKFAILVRYKPGISTWGAAPPGYGVVVEAGRVRVIGGSHSYAWGFGSDSYEGCPEENRSFESNAALAHTYLVTIEENRLTILMNGQRLYKHQLPKHPSGSVVIYGTDVKIRIRNPVAKMLP